MIELANEQVKKVWIMIKAQDIINKIFKFMKQAGELAIKKQQDIDFFASKLKDNGVVSVVTQTDFAISNLFRDFICQEFSILNPLIIDEEKLEELQENPAEKIKEAEYAFIIDPLDGTLPYSAKLPLYGISIGVFRRGVPYIGALYAPALHSMVYCDDEKVYAIENVFENNEIKKEIVKTPDHMDNPPIIFASPAKIKLNSYWSRKEIVPIDMYSAVIHCLNMAKGQARGYYFRAYLWDIAGSLPIFAKLEIKVFEMESGKEYAPLETGILRQDLKCRQVYIVCRPKYFEYLRKIADQTDDYH